LTFCCNEEHLEADLSGPGSECGLLLVPFVFVLVALPLASGADNAGTLTKKLLLLLFANDPIKLELLENCKKIVLVKIVFFR
jgi:hypothetical protein